MMGLGGFESDSGLLWGLGVLGGCLMVGGGEFVVSLHLFGWGYVVLDVHLNLNLL